MELIYEFLRWRQLFLPGDFALELGCPVLLFKRIPTASGTRDTRTMTGPLKMMIEVRNLLAEANLQLRSEAHEMRVFRVRPHADGRRLRTIGRAAGNDLVLNHGSVSKHHLDLQIATNSVTVIDQQSKNGTSIDSVKINGPTVLVPGRDLQAGSVPMRFLDPFQFFDALSALIERR